MKKNLWKYLGIALVFIIGISLGNVSNKPITTAGGDVGSSEIPEDDEWLIIEEIEGNFFVKLAKGSENIIKKIITFIFDLFHKLIRVVFGM